MRFRAFLLAAWVGVVPCSAMGQSPAGGATSPPPRPPVGGDSWVAVVSAPSAPAPSAPAPTLGAAPDLAGLTGRRITGVRVVLDSDVWGDGAAAAPGGVKSGDVFSASVARRVLDEVLASGGFARGYVAARTEAEGVRLEVRVVPRRLIGRVHVDLHGAGIDRDELLRGADLMEGGEIVGADLDSTKARIRRTLALHGYPSARVDIAMRAMEGMRVLVLLDVTPGLKRTVEDRQFYVFDAKPAAILPMADSYGIRRGDRADEPAIEQADSTLEQSLRSKGWHRAVVSHDLVLRGGAASADRVVLRVRIDAGPAFVAQFEGNEHYDAEVLTSVLGLPTETDRSLSHLADKIRTFYQKRGFLDAEVQVEPRGDDRVQVAVFHVDEHQRVRVSGRSYPCLKLEAIKNLDGGGPRSPRDVGTEIDSYLDEELPGEDLIVSPNPRGLDATIGGGGGPIGHGTRSVPIDLSPSATYMADTYGRATEHLRELYRSEGFLHAEVGPVQILRAHCDPRFSAGSCVSLPPPALPDDVCAYDASGLPAPLPAQDPSLSCRPDPARGVECAPSIRIVIPIRLGPRAWLWDVAFTGVKSVAERAVADAARVPLGEAASTAKLEDARRRIVDWYKELGYYYVDVKYAIESSPDNTRTRVRFDVAEGDQVIVRDIILRGLDRTKEGVVRRRIALGVERPYRTSDIRKTQERVATLGVFASVTVSLSEPYVPQARKDVIVEVVERDPQYIEVRPGFSTGEGVRGVFEYGHRNLLGDAWAVTLHLQASYLPDFLILDPRVAQNYSSLATTDRIATRNTLTMSWPEMGLGPTVRAQLDGVYVRDLERDFTLFKASVLATVIWRPIREVQLRAGPDYEHNDVHLFQGGDIATYLLDNPGNTDLARLLRVPDGDSNVVAGSIVLTWDRRDTPFNAHRGTYLAASVEQVNSYPVQNNTANAAQQYEGHFFRLTQTLAAYLPLTNTITLAAELRFGEIANVVKCRLPFDASATPSSYCTYPDRLFFMGGVESMRGWLQDTFIPQEFADQIAADAYKSNSDPTKFTAATIPLRGGNLMVNPRVELRFPIRLPLEGALFCDLGNLWTDPNDFLARPLVLRADVGAGVRVDTPVGPLVFDYGINVTRRPYEDFGAFHFAIGLF
jgi:outer membrane protein insertion porin family